eukprot:4260147-Amphidinium_carterae.2
MQPQRSDIYVSQAPATTSRRRMGVPMLHLSWCLKSTISSSHLLLLLPATSLEKWMMFLPWLTAPSNNLLKRHLTITLGIRHLKVALLQFDKHNIVILARFVRPCHVPLRIPDNKHDLDVGHSRSNSIMVSRSEPILDMPLNFLPPAGLTSPKLLN